MESEKDGEGWGKNEGRGVERVGLARMAWLGGGGMVDRVARKG